MCVCVSVCVCVCVSMCECVCVSYISIAVGLQYSYGPINIASIHCSLHGKQNRSHTLTHISTIDTAHTCM